MCIGMYKAAVLSFQLKERKAENQSCFTFSSLEPVDGRGERMGRAAWLSVWNCVTTELQANTDTRFLGRCAVPEVPWEQKILPWRLLQPFLGCWRC